MLVRSRAYHARPRASLVYATTAQGRVMAFWSSQKLDANLSRLVDTPSLSEVDCNAVTLRIGGEIYITPGPEDLDVTSHTKQLLSPKAPFVIPPGQFAFLLTEEVVTIPPDVMGFISIKAKLKLKGLVNVSGFHVDPGWQGPLIFSVFNAGPAPVHLERGMPLFLLWIADLDGVSDKRKTNAGEPGIPPAIINGIPGRVNSIHELGERTSRELRTFEGQLQKIEEKQAYTTVVLRILIGLVIGLLVAFAPSIYKRFMQLQKVVSTTAEPASSGTSIQTPPANSGKIDGSQSPAPASTSHR